MGKAAGCACTGAEPDQERLPTQTLVVRVNGNSGAPLPDYGIPSRYYVCRPRSNARTQNTRSYPRQQLQQAIRVAHGLVIDDDRFTAANGRSYPQPFYVRGPNAANFQIPTNDRRIDVNQLVEFPIIRDSAGQYIPFVTGGDQGPDRVVFDGGTGYFAGVFTHRGEVNNNFHRAPGGDRDVNSPRIDLDFGPTVMDPAAYDYFWGFDRSGLPFKRTPTYPPASFPTTYQECPYKSGQCYCYDTVTIAGWFPRDAGLQAIYQACDDWKGQTVPFISSPLSTTKHITYNNTDWSIELSVYQVTLVGARDSTVDQQSCLTSLRSAMDNCQTNTVSQKIGGQYLLGVKEGTQQYILHPGDGNPAPPPRPSPTQEPFNT